MRATTGSLSRRAVRSTAAVREPQILEASVRLFRENGYAATTVQDVARAVGIHKGSLYHYIDSKASDVAEELNKRRFRTRAGFAWNPASVFELLPRLIEAGPRIFTSDEWIARRKSLGVALQH